MRQSSGGYGKVGVINIPAGKVPGNNDLIIGEIILVDGAGNPLPDEEQLHEPWIVTSPLNPLMTRFFRSYEEAFSYAKSLTP